MLKYLLALSLVACTAFAPKIKGAIVYQQDNLTQAIIDDLETCSKKYYKPRLIWDGVTIEANNQMHFLGLTDNPDHIFIRTRDENGNLLSKHIVLMLVIHELSHITSWRAGRGPDTEHVQWASGALDRLEQKTVACVEDNNI